LAVSLFQLGDISEHERRIWKVVAFLGRYGHQSADEILDMPTPDMQALAKGVSEIMKEEAPSLPSPAG